MILIDFIEDYGEQNLSKVLKINRSAVANWKRYYSAPKPELARKIVKLSGGVVNYVDIYEPYFRHKEGKALKNYREEYTQLSFNL